MKQSEKGKQFLQKEEGLVLTKYRDSAGLETVGWGHLCIVGEEIPRKITKEIAEELYAKDIEIVEKCIDGCIEVPINQFQYDALYSLIFNIGTGRKGFKGSTVLKKINQKASPHVIKHWWLAWKMAGGEPILLPRRQREWELYMS